MSIFLSKRTHQKVYIGLFVLLYVPTWGQVDTRFDSTKYANYIFLLYDSRPNARMSMRQMNANYISTYGLVTSNISQGKYKKYVDIGLLFLDGLFLLPLTHEEGHRSILTNEGIGSISKPYPNSQLIYYVTGVQDETLKQLRDNKLPTYIRLHSAGLESDLAITKRFQQDIFYGQSEYHNIKYTYFLRKSAILSYFLSVFIPSLASEIEEEPNELERDIVGHDIFGAIRHLHRPEMPFYRYTNYSDLTDEEQKFAKKIAGLSLLQILDPFLFGKNYFKLSATSHFNISLGFGLTPFGGQVIETVYLRKNKYNVSLSLEQSFNRIKTFWGFRLGLLKLPLNNHLHLTTEVKVWSQPEELSFNSSQNDFSAYIKSELQYKFLQFDNKRALGLLIGGIYKGQGYVIEELNLGRGLTMWGGIIYYLGDKGGK